MGQGAAAKLWTPLTYMNMPLACSLLEDFLDISQKIPTVTVKPTNMVLPCIVRLPSRKTLSHKCIAAALGRVQFLNIIGQSRKSIYSCMWMMSGV